MPYANQTTTGAIVWDQDSIDPQWFTNPDVGAVRGPKKYNRKGWYFLPAWLPDEPSYDVGPFRSRKSAMAEAIRLCSERVA